MVRPSLHVRGDVLVDDLFEFDSLQHRRNHGQLSKIATFNISTPPMIRLIVIFVTECVVSAIAIAQQQWTQEAELQPVVERGSAVDPAVPAPQAIEDVEFDHSAVVAGRVPAGVFEELPGFQVEKLFTVPKDELGSWVCITFDNKGRLLASDEGDKGICRITQPPLASSPPGTATVPSPPRSGEKVAEGRMSNSTSVVPNR